MGRRPAIVEGRHGAETANVAGRQMAHSIIITFIPRFDDALFFSYLIRQVIENVSDTRQRQENICYFYIYHTGPTMPTVRGGRICS